jgi:Contact-dependent growth inhibition CdiA C-terminal domain
MSAVGEAAARLTASIEATDRAITAVRSGQDSIDRMAALLDSALGDSHHPAAMSATTGAARAKEALSFAVMSLVSAGDCLSEYIAEILLVRGSGAKSNQATSTIRGSAGRRTVVPSRRPSPEYRAEGDPEDVGPRAPAHVQESIRIQNRTADVLASAGYRVRHLRRVHGSPSPDYDIEGRAFDCYAPERNTPLDTIRTRLKSKMNQKQAYRFVVNLDRTQHSAEDLRTYFAGRASNRMQELIVIKDGVISRIWP